MPLGISGKSLPSPESPSQKVIAMVACSSLYPFYWSLDVVKKGEAKCTGMEGARGAGRESSSAIESLCQ